MDAFEQFKEKAKIAWATFGALERTTGTAAPHLVRHARIRAGHKVLDVGCGTGPVALTAARLGAEVTGADLTPELVAQAKENAAVMGIEARFVEGDAEKLPFADASFDVVVSQFGHIFAPRPELATAEMLRVLRPGGTIAFSTWPPELFTGQYFQLTARYLPTPPPAGVSPPHLWGDPEVVRKHLGDVVTDLQFDRATMYFQTLSPRHMRVFNENTVGIVTTLVKALGASDPARLETMRRETEALIERYFEDNQVRQSFLMSRATKR